MKPLIDSNIPTQSSRSHPRQRARILAVSVYHYQAPEHELPGGEGARKQRDRSASLRAFRDVSTRYFRDEAPPHSRSDFLLFALISSIAAWPMLLMFDALIQLLGR